MGISKEKIKWYETYLEDYFDVFKSFTKADFEFYKSLGIENTKSYFVIASKEEELRKFACYYLLIKCLRFSTYMVTDYLDNLVSSSTEELLESELVILYNHKHVVNIGGTENLLWKKVLSKVANRNRTRNRTILLTERDVPYVRNSGEFIVLDLNNKINPKIYITEGKDTVVESEQSVKNKEVANALKAGEAIKEPLTAEQIASIGGYTEVKRD